MSGPKRTRQVQSSGSEVELRRDGWERFRTAVHAAAKSGPLHRLRKHKPEESEAKKPDNEPS